MRAKELLQSARKTGIPADPKAGSAFKMAAVQLAAEEMNSEGRHIASRLAAESLVSLALAEDESSLRSFLSPDPTNEHVTWTVACYQIGDLTPTALRDFADPVEAVALLAACPEENHVAGELLSSTSHGLRWTAMTRINDDLGFQLPDADTASDASREHSTELFDALQRWRQQLLIWGVPELDIAGDALPAPVPVAEAQQRVDTSPDQSIERRLERIEAHLERLTADVATVAERVQRPTLSERLPVITTREAFGLASRWLRRRGL
jgi:hypothetical protein